MQNYVVMTHYQLMYSIMHAYLNNKGNARLFISGDYINFDNINLDRVLEEKIFAEVEMFDTKPIQQDFFAELGTLRPELAFSKILEEYFEAIFGKSKNEIFYVFNEFQLYYYYVEKYASEIIIVEDGYASYEQQNKILCFKGQYKLIDPYIGKEFPAVHATSSKVVKYLVNEEVKQLAVHNNLIEICNFKDMENSFDKNVLFDIYSSIYTFPNQLRENSVLLLTQPLKRANYCRSIDQMKLYKKIIEEELSKYDYIYIKPHPADDISYEYLVSDKVELLSSDFPVEVFNYNDNKFDLTYTFGSTASKIAKYSENNVSLYSRRKSSHNEIARFIKKYVKRTKIEILHVVELTEQFFLENRSLNDFSVKSNMDFIYRTVVLNNTDYEFNCKYDMHSNTDCYGVFKKYNSNYALFVKDNFNIEPEITRELNYFFRNFYADTISTISTFTFKYKGVYNRIAVDKLSLLYNNYDIIMASGVVMSGDVVNNHGLFYNIDIAGKINPIEYYTDEKTEEAFHIFVKKMCERQVDNKDELLMQSTLMKLGMIIGVNDVEWNLNNRVLVDVLKENVFIDDVKLYKLKNIKETYIKIYYKLKVEQLIRKVRNSSIEHLYLKVKNGIVKE